MAAAFQILIALLASPGQSGAVTTTENSTLSTELSVSAPSAYISPKHNYTVAAVNRNKSGGRHSIPTPADIADHTINSAKVTSGNDPEQDGESQTTRGTSSAVKWVDGTVTNASQITETVDTLLGSVRDGKCSSNSTKKYVLTSLTATATTTAAPYPRSPMSLSLIHI